MVCSYLTINSWFEVLSGGEGLAGYISGSVSVEDLYCDNPMVVVVQECHPHLLFQALCVESPVV